MKEDDTKKNGWRVLLSSNLLRVKYLVYRDTSFAYPVTVTLNDHWNEIRNGIGMNVIGGFGITVSFSTEYDMMIEWEEVMRGIRNEVQVWKEGLAFGMCGRAIRQDTTH